MKKTMIRIVLCVAAWLSIMPIGSSISMAQSANQKVTVTGMVSCAHCRKIHPAKGWTNSSCALMCVRGGSDFVLVVGRQMYGNKVYKLDGNLKVFEKLAGGQATLLGHFEDTGNTLYVERVVADK